MHIRAKLIVACVRSAVDLNDKFPLPANEIRKELRDRRLPGKLVPSQLSIAEILSQQHLSR
jgi:hypothetical protein